MRGRADTKWILQEAQALGFSLAGVARAQKFPELERFPEWLGRGYAGEMRYLEDRRRQDPRHVFDPVRSAIVCALNYHTDLPLSTEAAAETPSAEGGPRGWISRYAWGDDYHDVLGEKLNALLAALKERVAVPFQARAYVDAGPVAERVLARHAGLGWLGKNTLLLNAQLGSFFFLGVILTSLDLEPTLGESEALPPDLCGQCRQCLDACPTGALVEPYVLDARRCISYLTIELKAGIPERFREAIGGQVFGCDICQDVCPFNRGAQPTQVSRFLPRQTVLGESLYRPRLVWLAGMSEAEFQNQFRRSAVKRAKWRGLVRNALIALGNAKIDRGTAEEGRARDLLLRLSRSNVSMIAESARWALSCIQ